ncbi:AraC-like DNA-binding protein [Arthrobacter sp. PvP102]|jgi:AraC-like DNA-binding protein|uniref:AraC-like ligand-binding domain-containing protein n=1 Tax=unclassified Arthrobacter TaxID=235627 RepID=UPI0000527D02|nr:MULTISPECIES: helix-turn-helix domain-containing protein [unclassified Arthrobacter]ABK04879.1 transcriptional regulator, AraC family [Arthrobacter sp. FB24]MBP1232851.1 AraC-like DNA-binding protein [Arthrobacter sp. PvP103]MBP1237986.1 AraC-like DNA-binding protein [Arthrobacter sp. PvP102]
MSAITARPAGQDLTSSVATSFDHWRHLVAQSFVPLAAETDHPDTFRGRMRSRVLDRLCIVEVSASGHSVHRTPALVARPGQRYFKLNLQLEGTGLLIQDNREAVLRPGDLAIYDTNRPYTLAFEEQARVMVVMFPHDSLSLPPDYVGQLSAVRLAGGHGLTGIVGPFIAQLAENLEALSGPSGSRLAANALDLVSTMLHSELDMARDSMKPQVLLATSVREYIEANLADPQLSPASIAAAHFISTRHLHNIFHETGTTVASWIRSQRLERIRRDLRDPLLNGTSVGAVAARWGFLDAAHFSRTFRDAYGESPSDWRRGA